MKNTKPLFCLCSKGLYKKVKVQTSITARKHTKLGTMDYKHCTFYLLCIKGSAPKIIQLKILTVLSISCTTKLTTKP